MCSKKKLRSADLTQRWLQLPARSDFSAACTEVANRKERAQNAPQLRRSKVITSPESSVLSHYSIVKTTAEGIVSHSLSLPSLPFCQPRSQGSRGRMQLRPPTHIYFRSGRTPSSLFRILLVSQSFSCHNHLQHVLSKNPRNSFFMSTRMPTSCRGQPVAQVLLFFLTFKAHEICCRRN